VTDRNLLIAGGILGALAGVAVGYVCFTDEGRQWRTRAEETLDVLMQEAERMLTAADQVRQSVAELRDGTRSGWPRSA
jgi:hypothetical protein